MAITATDLTKNYGARMVVDHVSFSLPRGQTLGLLGPNGAGKSTTMRMLMGLARPTSGSATILNYDLLTQTKQIQARIGVVFEKPNLFENLSGYHNLTLFCRLYRQPLSLVRPLLERMELGDRAHDPVKIYSKGMRQRILILRALIHQPQVLFLDEPCSGLDPVSTRMIRDYLLELKAQGTTILLTSHDMEEVDELCDLIGFINHGQLITLAPKQELKAAYGSRHLKVIYRDGSATREAMLDPTVDLPQLETWYRENRVIAVRSAEATLAEIFRKLSNLK
jgi:ABC-2 type transport system ATP-binding protein